MADAYNWKDTVNKLDRLLKLSANPVGMKLFADAGEMKRIPKLRMMKDTLLLCQIVGQAVRMGFTVGAVEENLGSPQCGVILGFAPADDEWEACKMHQGSWFVTEEDTRAHQRSMYKLPYGKYNGVVVSPLNSERLEEPDICLIYANPGQMFFLCSGFLNSGYKRINSSIVGESSCSDAWGRALLTGEPSMSLPCYAERRFAGVGDNEMLMAMTPPDLLKAVAGMERLSGVGLRYPIPPYGTQMDIKEGLKHLDLGRKNKK